MNPESSRKGIIATVAAAGLVAGAIGGFFAAHMMMGDMAPGKGGVSVPPGRAGEMGEMKGMQGMQDMKGMQGTESSGSSRTAPTGAVAVPAATRQLIGVRSAPVGLDTLEQEVRTVGTVEYNERGFTQVNIRVSGWVQDVFVNTEGVVGKAALYPIGGDCLWAGQSWLARSDDVRPTWALFLT